ncbi:contactin-6-like [Hypanus sabinus]|uniref:contactin-6-like n=1 Tax=Hypanus sabinus TaxID=79690 RepID=UPI0028C398BC|nr:contactin-6-like [Hypanus sabinus]
MLLLALLFTLGVFNTKAEREEVVCVLGSSVLLDPEITIDSSSNEILWTFKTSNKSHDVILDHIPGVATLEPSEQFKDRLQFNALTGALTISRLNASDQGDYTFTVDGKELKIMELLVIDKVKEEFGLLGSAVLLDPELKVDPSKSEIIWTFISRSILHHIPGHSLVELSDEFKFRLHFNTSNGALTVNGAEHGDQGDYTFIVDGQELRIIQLRLLDELSEGSIFTNIELLGSTIELTCEVFGDSNVYQWQKNGGEISQHQQLTDENRTLVIPSASFEDCGVYTCITTNPVSSIQANYTLMLRASPSLQGLLDSQKLPVPNGVIAFGRSQVTGRKSTRMQQAIRRRVLTEDSSSAYSGCIYLDNDWLLQQRAVVKHRVSSENACQINVVIQTILLILESDLMPDPCIQPTLEGSDEGSFIPSHL